MITTLVALKTAIDEGLDSGTAENFDPHEYLKALKASRV